MSKRRRNPETLRPCMVTLSEAESARVRQFCKAAGSIQKARVRLGIGEDTIDAARDCGRMMGATRERLIAALDREEAHPYRSPGICNVRPDVTPEHEPARLVRG